MACRSVPAAITPTPTTNTCRPRTRRPRTDMAMEATTDDTLVVDQDNDIPRDAPGKKGPEGRPMQITMSPYYGKPDFSPLTGNRACREQIDLVSVADILRNAAVFPPHSIFEGLKMATFGFDPSDDMSGTPQFKF